MVHASSSVVAMGFSQSTCTPPSRAGITSRAWFLFSEQTTTASTSSNSESAFSKNRTPKSCCGLSAAIGVFVRDPDEIRRIEVPEHGGVGRGVDVGEADDADPDAHCGPPSVTGSPVRTDSVAARPILSAS